jgi:hypothetical protein
VSEIVSLDGVMRVPGGNDEDRGGAFEHGSETSPFDLGDVGTRFVRLT